MSPEKAISSLVVRQSSRPVSKKVSFRFLSSHLAAPSNTNLNFPGFYGLNTGKCGKNHRFFLFFMLETSIIFFAYPFVTYSWIFCLYWFSMNIGGVDRHNIKFSIRQTDFIVVSNFSN
jgi:hypothetical protein